MNSSGWLTNLHEGSVMHEASKTSGIAVPLTTSRCIAQSGSASTLGVEGPPFKSEYTDKCATPGTIRMIAATDYTTND